MRLRVSSYISLLLSFAILVKFALASATPLELPASYINDVDQISQSSRHKLNKDGERSIIHTTANSKIAGGHHLTKHRPHSLQGTLPVYNVALRNFVSDVPAVYDEAQHFTPLFHFLLYPKHWFW